MTNKITSIEKSEQIHFNEYAKKYDSNYGYFNPFTRYKIDKKFNILSNYIREYYGGKSIKILDIGCGTGEYTKKIAKKFPKVKIVGLDISPEIVNIARAKCKKLKNVSFVVRSAFETKYKQKSFDMVVGFYVLHHIDIPRFSKEACRILKDNGKIFFYEPNILNPVVFLIKSNKFIKKMVGDSPNEWAINPLTVNNLFKEFTIINLYTTEFIPPFNFLPVKFMKLFDKMSNVFMYTPIVKYFGGSVQMLFKKK